MFCTRVAWVCLVCLLLCKEEGSSPVFLQYVVEVMVLCLFYLIYRQLLIQLIMIIFFCILEKYVGISGNALKLITSYFSNRIQRVQIDDVL